MPDEPEPDEPELEEDDDPFKPQVCPHCGSEL